MASRSYRPDGHHCFWRSRVRDGYGEEGVRGQEPGERDLSHHVVRTSAHVIASANDSARARPRGEEVLGEGAGEKMAGGQ